MQIFKEINDKSYSLLSLMNKFTMRQLFLYISILIGIQTFAQNACSSSRYYQEVFSNTNKISGIQFGQADPYGLISNQNLYLDITQPTGDTLEKRPLVLHQFGGGFLIGWRTEPVIPQMGEMYAKRGFIFATIDYRLGFNPLDGQSAERAVYRASQDLRAALRFLVDNADIYGIDTSAIFLTGTSAGCLSAVVSTYMNESDRADIPSTYGILLEPADLGCSNCSGNNNFNNQEVTVHGIINNWGAILDTSYINPATDPADNVPVISFHGTNDQIVPYGYGQPFNLPIFPTVMGSQLVHQRLDNLGIKNKLYPLQGLGHEPQLLQLQTWVTDTIIHHGSQFVYEIMYGDSIEISGDATLCLNDTGYYSLPLNAESQYCWDVIGGTIIQQNNNEISILWNNLGVHTLSAFELTKREISKEAQLQVNIQTPPTPMLSYTSYDGLFDFTSANNANTYTWNFGDGNTASGITASNQYVDTANYTVSLSIENDFCSATKDTIIKSTLCPTADFEIIQNDSSFTFINASINHNNGFFITNDGTIVQADTFAIDFTAEGSYSLGILVSNDFCSDTFTQTFPIAFCSQADYNYTTNQLQVDFQEDTYNAYFYAWDFGDGNSSALPNPIHNYALPGVYDCQLICTSIAGCTDTISKIITVDLNNAIRETPYLDLKIKPNPIIDKLFIDGLVKNEVYHYQIFTVDGKIVLENKLENNSIRLTNIPSGLYFVQISNSKATFIQKIVLKS